MQVSIGEKLIISEKIIALLDADVSPKLASRNPDRKK